MVAVYYSQFLNHSVQAQNKIEKSFNTCAIVVIDNHSAQNFAHLKPPNENGINNIGR
jgi:hypothetical protein